MLTNKHAYAIYVAITILLAVFFRTYQLNFGLPHNFYADEPEFTELAIKYTYQIRNIIKTGDYFELIPISYVYGTVPTYFLTVCLMIFSKSLNVFNIAFDKTTIFVFFRAITVGISMLTIYVSAVLGSKIAPKKDVLQNVLTLALLALNYKLIVHSHYVNADIILTLLLLTSFVFFYNYLQLPDNKNLFISAIFFGLAAGTKITALMSLPIFLYFIIKKRDLYGIPGFILSTSLAFIVTNPFSLAFFGDFSYRIYSMLAKEGGMVFDSVDYSPLKYVVGLIDMASLPVILLFIYELFRRVKTKSFSMFDMFLLLNFGLYMLFFSVQSRRVDRWLLPILPVILIYAGAGLARLNYSLNTYKLRFVIALAVFAIYSVKPLILLTQFQRWTPKSQAYLWATTNLPETATKLSYTEEGLDPLNKLGFAKVYQFNVYESAGAQLFYPEDPLKYEYVILASRPMTNFKRAEVVAKYPNYTRAWEMFEQTVQDTSKFELVKNFTLSKPNLIPLSDVFIYKRL